MDLTSILPWKMMAFLMNCRMEILYGDLFGGVDFGIMQASLTCHWISQFI